MKQFFPLLGLALLLGSGWVSAAGTPAAKTDWSRVRYEVDAAGPTPACAYTLIQNSAQPGATRQRVLFSDARGRHLVAELKTKVGASQEAPASRWLNFYLLPGGQHVALAFVAGSVEAQLEATTVVSTALGHVSASEFAEFRDRIPEGLVAAIEDFVRIGLTREPALHDAAQLVAGTLFLGVLPTDLTLSATDRRRIVETPAFDPATAPALAGEQAFGALYGQPHSD